MNAGVGGFEVKSTLGQEILAEDVQRTRARVSIEESHALGYEHEKYGIAGSHVKSTNEVSSSEVSFQDKQQSVDIEKVSSNQSSVVRAGEVIDESVAYTDGQPFPVDPSLPVETSQGSFRAMILGTALGFIVAASNIYLGLKTGFTFGAGLFAAIFGFALMKPFSRLPTRWGGGYFGPKENVTIQSAAGASGGLSGLFVAAVPAIYQLGLMDSSDITGDFGKLALLSFITAFYGLYFAVPLRKYYILKQKLVFPSPTATAYTIRSLHTTSTPEARAASSKKLKILAITFAVAFVWVVISKYVPGLLWFWSPFWWMYTWGWTSVVAAQSWGWYINLTPAFTGAGFLVGRNSAYSWLFGAILSYGIIGPATVATGKAFGNEISTDDGDVIPGFFNYNSMTLPKTASGEPDYNHASPRYWLLWSGVLIMLTASFTELAVHGPLFYRSLRNLVNDARIAILQRRGKDTQHIKCHTPEASEDPAPPHEQVPIWAWSTGLTVSVVTTIIVAKYSFNLSVGTTILSLVLGFLFAFVGVQASGTTDVNPLGVIAKASQLIIGGVTKGQHLSLQRAQITNLIAGSIAGQSASHSVDMIGDLKTGHYLGASPKSQFWAQGFGSLFGFSFAPGLYVLFSKAYPCINDLSYETCPFGVPSVSAWRAVTIAVTAPSLPISKSSGFTAIGLGIFAALMTFVKIKVVPQKYKGYFPNWSAVGLAFVIPQVYYAIAMTIGATFAYYMEKRRPKTWEIWGFSLAAGLIAGEGIAGVFNAILTIAGASGDEHGVTVGCPAWSLGWCS